MTFTYNEDPSPKRMFDFVSTFHASRIFAYYSSGYIRAGGAGSRYSSFIESSLRSSEEAGGERGGGVDEKSERRVGGERSRNDRRSVLKSLLNLSLPSETAHIYRQYRGSQGLAAGRLRNRMVDTNLHLPLV